MNEFLATIGPVLGEGKTRTVSVRGVSIDHAMQVCQEQHIAGDHEMVILLTRKEAL